MRVRDPGKLFVDTPREPALSEDGIRHRIPPVVRCLGLVLGLVLPARLAAGIVGQTFAVPLAHAVDQKSTGDGEGPGHHRRAGREVPPGGVHLEKSLLYEVLRAGWIARAAQAGGKYCKRGARRS